MLSARSSLFSRELGGNIVQTALPVSEVRFDRENARWLHRCRAELLRKAAPHCASSPNPSQMARPFSSDPEALYVYSEVQDTSIYAAEKKNAHKRAISYFTFTKSRQRLLLL